MEKYERLLEYHKSLCDILNKNGIKNKIGNTELDWKVYDDTHPYSTFLGGIYSNGKAFYFLKENGYLDKGICPSCGNSPIDNTYSYRSGLSPNRVFYICRNCSNEGKKTSIYHSDNDDNGFCYIATVCYGDYNASEVKILRNYRDEVLAQSILGRFLIKAYYFLSCRFANWLVGKRKLTLLVKRFVLDKIVDILR